MTRAVTTSTLSRVAVVLLGNALLAAALVVAGAPALAGLIVVALAIAVVTDRPQRGILLLAALAPFDGLLLLTPGTPFVRSWSEGLVVLTFLATFLAPADARGPAGRRLPGWFPALAGLVVVGFLSAIAVGGVQALVGLKIWFFYVLVGFAAWRCPLDASERDRLVTILMVTGLITALIGLLQQVMGPGALNQLGYEYNSTIRFAGGRLRSFSSFNQPFGFGFYLMLVILIGIPQAVSDPRRPRNQLFLVSLPFLVLGILTTIVRAAWLGLAVGLAYLGAGRYRVLLMVIPLALVAILLAPRDTLAPALSTHSSEDRLAGWQQNAAAIRDAPLGNGIGATGSAAEKVAKLTAGGDTYQPDNFYFKTVYELGPVGLWLLVLLLVAAFLSTRAAARRLSGRDAALGWGVAAAILAAAVASLAATYFEIFPMDLLFWLLLAVIADVDAQTDTAPIPDPAAAGATTGLLKPL